MKTKTIHIVAGPNGSGKTTFAYSFVLPRGNGSFFINADTVAAGLSPNHSESAAFQAGRFVINEIRKQLSEGHSFCFESTLSGLSWQSLLKDAKALGYRVVIYFVYVDKISISTDRIKARVAEGGHHIPSAILRRRTPRSFYNFWNIYRHLADDWYIFDNSSSVSKLCFSKNAFETSQEKIRQKFEAFIRIKGKLKGKSKK